MARIRTIKPAFFKHSGLYEAEVDYGLPLRLAFAGLWTIADRAGRFKWRPKDMKPDILPHDAVDFSRVLDALCARGFIFKYEHDEEFYGVIPTFNEHQFINNREAQSIFPEPPKDTKKLKQFSLELDASATRGSRVDHATGTRLEQDRGEGKGREGKGKDSPPPPSRTVGDASGTAGGDLITGLADEIWAMAGQTNIAEGKRAGGFIDDYRLVKGWLDGGHAPEAIRGAAKATIDSSGDIRSLWGLLAKAVPARLTEGAARSVGGEYGYDPASAHKELYARCVVFFMMGKWRERMASGKVIGPAPYTEGCLVPPEIIAAAKMDPKVIAAQAQKATA